MDLETLKVVLSTLPFKIDGQPVDFDTWITTVAVREAAWYLGIYMLSKGLRIKFRQAYAIAAAFSLFYQATKYVYAKSEEPEIDVDFDWHTLLQTEQ